VPLNPVDALVGTSLRSAGATLATLTASVLTAPLNFRLLGSTIEFGRRELLDILWRPCIGALAMIVLMLGIKALWALPSSLFGQIGYVVFVSGAGALAYAVTRFVLWWPRSDPDGSEAWVLDRAGKLSDAVRGRIGASFR
jgi:hypothetical protein